MKFDVIHNLGSTRVKAPKMVQFANPKWLSECRFVSHHTVSRESVSWALSESSTGCAVVKDCATRAEAESEGFKILIQAGMKKTLKYIAEWVKHKENTK